MTSVSVFDVKRWPLCSSSRRSAAKLYISPLYVIHTVRSSLHIGMCPATDRSRMARRRLPRPIYEPSGMRRSHRPKSSGPRCACTCVMRASVSRSPQFTTPLIPHIGLALPLSHAEYFQLVYLCLDMKELYALQSAVNQAGNAIKKSQAHDVFVEEKQRRGTGYGEEKFAQPTTPLRLGSKR